MPTTSSECTCHTVVPCQWSGVHIQCTCKSKEMACNHCEKPSCYTCVQLSKQKSCDNCGTSGCFECVTFNLKGNMGVSFCETCTDVLNNLEDMHEELLQRRQVRRASGLLKDMHEELFRSPRDAVTRGLLNWVTYYWKNFDEVLLEEETERAEWERQWKAVEEPTTPPLKCGCGNCCWCDASRPKKKKRALDWRDELPPLKNGITYLHCRDN